MKISSTEFLHLCDYLEEQIPGVEKGQISTDTARTIILRITETNEAHTIDEDELLDLYTNLNSGVDLLSFINRLLIAAPNPQSAHRRSTGAIVDLDEEDALTRETGNSYLSGNDSTIGLDMPSTIPIRSSTPVGGYRSGTQGRGNTPPTNPLFEDKDFKTLKLPFTGVPLSREQLHALPRADIEAYYSEWRILRRDYKKVIDEIKISKGDVKEKDLELRNLQITFEERLQAYRQDIEDLRKDGKDSEEMLQRLKKENESLHQNIEELEGLLEKSEEGNHELGEEKDRRQDQAKSAERRIIELEGKLGGRDKFDQTTSTQFSQMQKRFDDQERAKSEAIEEAGRLNDLCLKLQHDLEKASEEVAALKDNNQLLNRDINQLERTPTTTDAGSNVGEPEDLGTIMNLANIASSDIFLGEHVELETVVVMNRCGKEVQTDIVIPSALDHKEALLMMNDPELGAVKMIRALVGCGGLRHKALFSDVLRVIDGLNVRSSEEAAADITTAMEAEARRAAKSGRAFPPIPQDEQGYFPVIEHQKETFSGPESNGTQTIPPPEDTYEESIKTDHATVTKIKSLLQKPTLDVDEATFLNEFTEQQLGFLLKAFWNLKVKADRAARSAGRTNAIHTMHSLFNWLPFSFRQIWNMVYSLDAADEAARAFEAEKNPGGENTNEPANGEQLRQAPKSPLAVLLLARPRPGSVWSILTMFLFMLLVALLVGNLHMYLTMHREQSMWADVNDGPPAWRSGCWRVCSGSGGGSGWRWKGIIREWLSEGILG